MSPDRTHAGQAFGDMVDTCAGSLRSSAPGSSDSNRMVRQKSMGIGRKAAGWLRRAFGSRSRRPRKDGFVPI